MGYGTVNTPVQKVTRGEILELNAPSRESSPVSAAKEQRLAHAVRLQGVASHENHNCFNKGPAGLPLQARSIKSNEKEIHMQKGAKSDAIIGPADGIRIYFWYCAISITTSTGVFISLLASLFSCSISRNGILSYIFREIKPHVPQSTHDNILFLQNERGCLGYSYEFLLLSGTAIVFFGLIALIVLLISQYRNMRSPTTRRQAGAIFIGFIMCWPAMSVLYLESISTYLDPPTLMQRTFSTYLVLPIIAVLLISLYFTLGLIIIFSMKKIKFSTVSNHE